MMGDEKRHSQRLRRDRREPRPNTDAAAEMHMRIMVEQMVREGRSSKAIEAAVRRAAPDLRSV
jgi:hypothetical protein